MDGAKGPRIVREYGDVDRASKRDPLQSSGLYQNIPETQYDDPAEGGYCEGIIRDDRNRQPNIITVSSDAQSVSVGGDESCADDSRLHIG